MTHKHVRDGMHHLSMPVDVQVILILAEIRLIGSVRISKGVCR